MFYVNFVKLCNSVGKSPSSVAEEIGIKRSTVTRWKQGKSQTDANIQKVADYFGVSVSDLTEDKEKSPAPEGAGLDKETIQLREIWESADKEERKALLAMAEMLKSRRNK